MEENSDFRFVEFEKLKKYGGFDSSRYEQVYRFDIPLSNEIKGALEYIFRLFNAPYLRPDDYRGRSISVSDVIVIESPDFERGAFYCDKIGWVPLKELWVQEGDGDGYCEACRV